MCLLILDVLFQRANLREALVWLDATGRVEAALCLAYKLRYPWEQHGHLSEIRDWLERLLTRADDVSPGVLAKALLEAGALAASLSARQNRLLASPESRLPWPRSA